MIVLILKYLQVYMSDKILRDYVQVLGRYSVVVVNLWTYRYNGILPYICNILYSTFIIRH